MEAKNVYKNQYHDTAMRFNGFFKLMCVWKGSVIKLIYHDLAMFLILYGRALYLCVSELSAAK